MAAALLLVLAHGCARRRPDSAHPQQLLDDAPPGAVVRLPPGLVEGPLVLRRPVTLMGAGAGRTVVRAQGVALDVQADAEVSGVTVRGGRGGLVAERPATIRVVDSVFEGAAEAVIWAGNGVRLRLADVTVSCATDSPAAVGVAIARAELDGERLRVGGPCRRNLEVREGSVELRASEARGARESAIVLIGADARLTDVDAANAVMTPGDAYAVILSARSVLRVDGLRTSGGEFGLVVRGGEVAASRLHVAGARAAGLALREATAVLEAPRLDGPFAFAAVQANDGGHVTLRRLRVMQAGAVGILALRAPLVVEGADIEGGRRDRDGDFGHGIVVQEGEASLSEVRGAQLPGALIWASHARVTVRGASGRQVGEGVVAANKARMDVTGLEVDEHSGHAVVSGEDALVLLAESRLASRVGLVRCGEARVVTGPEVEITAPEPEGDCEGTVFAADR